MNSKVACKIPITNFPIVNPYIVFFLLPNKGKRDPETSSSMPPLSSIVKDIYSLWQITNQR